MEFATSRTASGYDRRMVSRRRLLLLLGSATTGIWLASTGLVRFERRLLLTVAGSCSFCGKTGTKVLTLVGTAGRSVRICDECVGVVLRYHRGGVSPLGGAVRRARSVPSRGRPSYG